MFRLEQCYMLIGGKPLLQCERCSNMHCSHKRDWKTMTSSDQQNTRTFFYPFILPISVWHYLWYNVAMLCHAPECCTGTILHCVSEKSSYL